MLLKLILVIILIVLVAVLVGFNAGSVCTFWFFQTFESVHVIALVLGAFILGLLFAIPFSFEKYRIKKETDKLREELDARKSADANNFFAEPVKPKISTADLSESEEAVVVSNNGSDAESENQSGKKKTFSFFRKK